MPADLWSEIPEPLRRLRVWLLARLRPEIGWRTPERCHEWLLAQGADDMFFNALAQAQLEYQSIHGRSRLKGDELVAPKKTAGEESISPAVGGHRENSSFSAFDYPPVG